MFLGGASQGCTVALDAYLRLGLGFGFRVQVSGLKGPWRVGFLGWLGVRGLGLRRVPG